jgi:2,4-dienoyl-CoA reductase (NADPH2)
MEAEDIAAVVTGFGTAAASAAAAGLDGVEVNAGQHSLIRQFLSGLTNQRGDEWGTDRLRFARDVLAAVRGALGPDRVLGLRLSGDELAPWAVTPDQAPGIAAELAAVVDYLVVVRGAIYSAEKTRPDFHEPPGFNIELCRAVRQTVPDEVAVVLQGSVVDVGQAGWALEDGVADAVEMTRAQIADPDLVAKLRAGTPERIRPCIRCNQTCQVRDARNPLVTCVGEPTSGRETEDPDWYAPTSRPRDVLVVGGARGAEARGPAGPPVAPSRLPSGSGGTAERGPEAPSSLVGGGTARSSPCPSARTSAWSPRAGEVVVQCSGSRRGDPPYEIVDSATVLDVAAVRAGTVTLPDAGPVVLLDPIGGPIAVALAEELGERAVLVTQDNIAGNELSRTGDLAPANVRLQQRGAVIERRTIVRAVRPGAPNGSSAGDAALQVEVEDRFSGVRRVLAAAAVVDCGFRLPDTPLPGVTRRAGDCVAPRTIHEAILEGRRAAIAL